MAYKNNKASYENTLLGVLFLTFGFVFSIVWRCPSCFRSWPTNCN